jgi:type I restriction enzyme R subunit
MWLTGFDAPSCSTIYLDKPMRNHTLMQTIARANRVFPGKHSGLIVDYANVFASLERALAIYGKGRDGSTPVRDKKQLVEMLRNALKEASVFCDQKGVSIAAIESVQAGTFKRVEMISKAVIALISPDPLRKELARKRAATLVAPLHTGSVTMTFSLCIGLYLLSALTAPRSVIGPDH